MVFFSGGGFSKLRTTVLRLWGVYGGLEGEINLLFCGWFRVLGSSEVHTVQVSGLRASGARIQGL